MSSVQTPTKVSNRASFLDKPVAGRTAGIVVLFALSLLLLLLSSPFFPWIILSAPGALFRSIGVTDYSKIYGGYTLYNFLSFVRESGRGTLGFPSMLLLISAVAGVLFHIAFLIRVFIRPIEEKGHLKLYSNCQVSMLFSFFNSLATIGFVMYANTDAGVRGYACSPIVYIVLLLSAAAYFLSKTLERRERVLYREHGFCKEFKKNWLLFLFLIPCFVYFIINNYLPMTGVYFAFTQFNFRDGLFASPFIGFKNFEFLAKSNLGKLTFNTVAYNVAFISIGNILQIFFAILVSHVASKWFKKTSQTLIFMPYFVSFVILKVIVYNVFEYEYGLINSMLVNAGLNRIDFYNSPKYWPGFILAFYLWKNLGYGMVVYLATIMGISDEYYDAAKVDGANIFQQIWYITVPLLKPTFIILLLYALGGIMKGQFELFYQTVGNNGVLYDVTDILDTYVYRVTTTQPLSMGLSAAAGLYQSVFGLVIVILTNWFIKRSNAEYALF